MPPKAITAAAKKGSRTQTVPTKTSSAPSAQEIAELKAFNDELSAAKTLVIALNSNNKTRINSETLYEEEFKTLIRLFHKNSPHPGIRQNQINSIYPNRKDEVAIYNNFIASDIAIDDPTKKTFDLFILRCAKLICGIEVNNPPLELEKRRTTYLKSCGFNNIRTFEASQIYKKYYAASTTPTSLAEETPEGSIGSDSSMGGDAHDFDAATDFTETNSSQGGAASASNVTTTKNVAKKPRSITQDAKLPFSTTYQPNSMQPARTDLGITSKLTVQTSHTQYFGTARSGINPLRSINPPRSRQTSQQQIAPQTNQESPHVNSGTSVVAPLVGNTAPPAVFPTTDIHSATSNNGFQRKLAASQNQSPEAGEESAPGINSGPSLVGTTDNSGSAENTGNAATSAVPTMEMLSPIADSSPDTNVEDLHYDLDLESTISNPTSTPAAPNVRQELFPTTGTTPEPLIHVKTSQTYAPNELNLLVTDDNYPEYKDIRKTLTNLVDASLENSRSKQTNTENNIKLEEGINHLSSMIESFNQKGSKTTLNLKAIINSDEFKSHETRLNFYSTFISKLVRSFAQNPPKKDGDLTKLCKNLVNTVFANLDTTSGQSATYNLIRHYNQNKSPAFANSNSDRRFLLQNDFVRNCIYLIHDERHFADKLQITNTIIDPLETSQTKTETKIVPLAKIILDFCTEIGYTHPSNDNLQSLSKLWYKERLQNRIASIRSANTPAAPVKPDIQQHLATEQLQSQSLHQNPQPQMRNQHQAELQRLEEQHQADLQRLREQYQAELQRLREQDQVKLRRDREAFVATFNDAATQATNPNLYALRQEIAELKQANTLLSEELLALSDTRRRLIASEARVAQAADDLAIVREELQEARGETAVQQARVAELQQQAQEAQAALEAELEEARAETEAQVALVAELQQQVDAAPEALEAAEARGRAAGAQAQAALEAELEEARAETEAQVALVAELEAAAQQTGRAHAAALAEARAATEAQQALVAELQQQAQADQEAAEARGREAGVQAQQARVAELEAAQEEEAAQAAEQLAAVHEQHQAQLEAAQRQAQQARAMMQHLLPNNTAGAAVSDLAQQLYQRTRPDQQDGGYVTQMPYTFPGSHGGQYFDGSQQGNFGIYHDNRDNSGHDQMQFLAAQQQAVDSSARQYQLPQQMMERLYQQQMDREQGQIEISRGRHPTPYTGGYINPSFYQQSNAVSQPYPPHDMNHYGGQSMTAAPPTTALLARPRTFINPTNSSRLSPSLAHQQASGAYSSADSSYDVREGIKATYSVTYLVKTLDYLSENTSKNGNTIRNCRSIIGSPQFAEDFMKMGDAQLLLSILSPSFRNNCRNGIDFHIVKKNIDAATTLGDKARSFCAEASTNLANNIDLLEEILRNPAEMTRLKTSNPPAPNARAVGISQLGAHPNLAQYKQY